MINGFSKFSKKEKINWLIENYFHGDFGAKDIIEKYLNSDEIFRKYMTNSLKINSNFYLPPGSSKFFN